MESLGTAAGRALAEADTGPSRVTRLQKLARQANRNADGEPVYLDRNVDIELSRRLVSFRPNSGPLEMRREMTLQERSDVEARTAALELWISPFGPDERGEIEASIVAMLAGFRSMRQQGEDIDSMVAITCAVLRDFPAWAIKKTCLKIARREIQHDARFAPNDAEIAGLVRDLVAPYRKNFEQANALLQAVVEPKRAAPTARKIPGPPPGDGKHGQRVAADIVARKAGSSS